MSENIEKRTRIRRSIIVLTIILVLVGIILGLYFGFGLNKKFKSAESTKEFLLQYGSYSRAFYVFTLPTNHNNTDFESTDNLCRLTAI